MRGGALGADVEPVVTQTGGHTFGDQQDEHHQPELIDPMHVPMLHALVDDQPDRLRVGERREDADHDEYQADRVDAPLNPNEAEQGAQLRGRRHRPQLSIASSLSWLMAHGSWPHGLWPKVSTINHQPSQMACLRGYNRLVIRAAIAGLVIAIGVVRLYETFAGENPVLDTLYDMWLRRQHLDALDARCAANPRRSDL